MNTLTKVDLAPLFESFRDVFVAQRDFLVDLDGKVGDSDLGLTMNKAFVAAYESVAANTTDPIGRTIQLAGMAMSKAAPSTMGTLVATGFMRGGKALESVSSIGTEEMSQFWLAFLNGVVERGKAKQGEKTLIDVLVPVSGSLVASVECKTTLLEALALAAEAAAKGLEATKEMIAQHGKAACFQEQTIGFQDAGATVGFIIADTLRAFVAKQQK